MEKQKVEIIITSVSVVIFLVLLTAALSKRAKKAPKEAPQKEPVAEVAVSKVYKPATQEKLTWGRDPFILGPKKPREERIPFVLTAVIWDEAEPHAVINNEIVVIGQEIKGYRVIEITKDSAILKKGDKELTIELYR